MEDAAQQVAAIAAKDLNVALGPALTLTPRLAKRGGLLVVEHGVGAEGHLVSPGDLVDRELDILRQQVEGPGTDLLQHGAAEEKTGAGHGAAGAQQKPGVVEVAALPQEPQGVTGADPVVTVVFGVAVAGDDLVAVGEGFVHSLDIVRCQQIVGVKDEIAVKAVGIVVLQMAQQRLQGIALAHKLGIEALIGDSAGTAGDLGRVIGTVIRKNKDADKLLIVGLAADAGDQIADHGGLVTGADQNGVAVGFDCAVRLILAQPRHGNIQKLVGIAQAKEKADAKVDPFQRFHDGGPFSRETGDLCTECTNRVDTLNIAQRAAGVKAVFAALWWDNLVVSV